MTLRNKIVNGAVAVGAAVALSGASIHEVHRPADTYDNPAAFAQLQRDTLQMDQAMHGETQIPMFFAVEMIQGNVGAAKANAIAQQTIQIYNWNANDAIRFVGSTVGISGSGSFTAEAKADALYAGVLANSQSLTNAATQQVANVYMVSGIQYSFVENEVACTAINCASGSAANFAAQISNDTQALPSGTTNKQAQVANQQYAEGSINSAMSLVASKFVVPNVPMYASAKEASAILEAHGRSLGAQFDAFFHRNKERVIIAGIAVAYLIFEGLKFIDSKIKTHEEKMEEYGFS